MIICSLKFCYIFKLFESNLYIP
eukprot:UN17545